MTTKRIPFLAVAFLVTGAPLSQAVTFLIDLGTNSTSGYPSGTWNAYDASTVKIASNLKDITGANTSVGFVGAGTIAQGGTPGTGVFDAANVPASLSWLATSSANGAASDWLYTTTTSGQSSHTYTFSNLTAGNIFSLDLFSSRDNASSFGRFSYSLDGGTNWIGFTVLEANGTPATDEGWSTNTTLSQNYNISTQGYDKYRYMNASNITLTGTSVVVRAQDVDVSASYAGINAMRFTVIPEPTAAILVSGLALSAFRRRR